MDADSLVSSARQAALTALACALCITALARGDVSAPACLQILCAQCFTQLGLPCAVILYHTVSASNLVYGPTVFLITSHFIDSMLQFSYVTRAV